MHCRSLVQEIKKYSLRCLQPSPSGSSGSRVKNLEDRILSQGNPLGREGYDLISEEDEEEVQKILRHMETIWQLYIYTIEHLT
jgi:hypothetical protein